MPNYGKPPPFKTGQVIWNWEILGIIGRRPQPNTAQRRWLFKVKCTKCGEESERFAFQMQVETANCVKCKQTRRAKLKREGVTPIPGVPNFLTMKLT